MPLRETTYLRGKRMTAGNEGKRSHVYVDTEGHPTVGIGLNLDREGCRSFLARWAIDYDAVRHGLRDLTDEEIEKIYTVCFDEAVQQARQVCPSFDEQAPEAQMVLIDLCFQMGIGRVRGFRKMLAAIARNDYEAAATELVLSHYAKQTPTRAQTNRALLLLLVPGANDEGDEEGGDDDPKSMA